jgi:hypothetical protein
VYEQLTTGDDLVAKRRLGVPLAPPGPQYDFFALMQDYVLRRGDKSLKTLASEMSRSRQALHRALRGPDLPSRELVQHMIKNLFAEDEEGCRSASKEALDAWTEAVADRIQQERGNKPARVGPTAYELALLRFAQGLEEVRGLAGRPSLANISRRGTGSLNKSAMSDWLRGRTLPGSFDRVVEMLDAMLRDRVPPAVIVGHRQRLERLWQAAVDARPRRGPT